MQKWTPSLRLFPAPLRSLATVPSPAAPSIGASASELLQTPPRTSVLYEHTPVERAHGDAAASHDKPEVQSISLPTLPQLLQFVAHHAQPELRVTPAVLRAVEDAEQEAHIIERAYVQTLEYMELWKAHLEAQSLHPQPDGEEVSTELRTRILATYRFVISEAGLGSAEAVIDRLATVSDFVESQNIPQRIETAFAEA